MAKLVDQLNEAARELATLRTANAKLRAERERPRPAPAVETSVKTDPAEERLAASLKSFGAFKQEMTALIAEVERLKKASSGADAELKAAGEQMRQAKAALARVEEDLRVEKRLRQEAEANAGQLRDQLRTIAKAMSDAGLSADKLASSADGATSRSRATTRPASKYVVREGDTLMKIADRVYGDTSKWRVILEANRGRVGTDGTLEAGVELEIPRN
jgi:nucleoid-associated protein YgaU